MSRCRKICTLDGLWKHPGDAVDVCQSWVTCNVLLWQIFPETQLWEFYEWISKCNGCLKNIDIYTWNLKQCFLMVGLGFCIYEIWAIVVIRL